MSGNVQESIELFDENFDKLIDDYDKIELVANFYSENNKIDKGVELIEKYKNKMKEDDNLDESKYTMMINYLIEHANDYDRAEQYLKEAQEHDYYLYSYNVDDVISILSIHGKKEFAMQYLEDNFNYNKCDEVLKIYLETLLKSEGEQTVIEKIDSILQNNDIPTKDVSEHEHNEIFSKNVLTSEINHGCDNYSFSTNSIIDIKGSSSFKEKFFKNEHMDNKKGIDYSKRILNSNTSINEISKIEDQTVKKNTQKSFLDIIKGSFTFFSNQIKKKEQESECQQEKSEQNIIGTELGLEDLFMFEIPQPVKQIDLFEETEVKTPKLIDIFSNEYTEPIVCAKNKEIIQIKFDKTYEDISLDSRIVKKLLKYKARMLSKTKGKQFGKNYLIANRDFFGSKIISVLFKYYQKCYDIEDILNLDNIYFGTLKRQFFDSMNIKVVIYQQS